MIKEAMELVKQETLNAAAVIASKLPAEPDDVYLLHDRKSGVYSRQVAEPKPRGYAAARLVDVVDLVTEFHGRNPDQKIVVFAAGGLVTVLLNEDGARRERFSLRCGFSAQYTKLKELVDLGEQMPHVEFLDLLKIDLHGAVPPEFLSLVKSLRFRADSSGTSDVSAGRESMGRQVENEVLAGGKAIPETVLIEVPVYEDLVDADGRVFKAKIECVFRVSAQNASLQLVPLDDELKAAVRLADTWVLDTLRPVEKLGSNVRVFCGAA